MVGKSSVAAGVLRSDSMRLNNCGGQSQATYQPGCHMSNIRSEGENMGCARCMEILTCSGIRGPSTG